MVNTFNLNIGNRIILGITVILILVMGTVIPFVLSEFTTNIDSAEQRELHKLYETATAEIESTGKLAQALATVVARNSDLQKLFAEGDRETLALKTLPLFETLKEDYAVRQFQFHLPPATSFLRVHKPEKFGDDLSSFRQTVIVTNRDQKPVRGLEKGVAGIGIRGIMPVNYQNAHIGSVEFGMSFGQAFFDQFKNDYKVDIALYTQKNGQFEAFGATTESHSFSDNTRLAQAFNGVILNNQSTLHDTSYAVYLHQVKDFSGQPIGVLEIALDRTHNVNAINDVTFTMISVGVIALLLGIAIAWVISRSITTPINMTTHTMNNIADGDGDLTLRLSVSGNDEITALSKAFNQFATKVHNTINQVMSATQQLNHSAERLSGITLETQADAVKQQQETEQVATAMNEMSATVQDVAQNATEAADAAQKANEATQAGKQVVSKVSSEINQLASEINIATHAVSDLQNQTTAIDSVLEVIRNISDQTNLLALNAAIEAARAGEQGRGFAVVADEVRTLASRTQASTQDIQAMIEQLQSGAAKAVQVMKDSGKVTDSCVTQAINADHALDDIFAAVNTITEMNIQIASAANEQCAVSNEINKNITNINDIVTKTTEGSMQTASASEDLADLSKQLNSLVGQFKI
ncbi:methyl-accepting chemotaxis protein [Shewanella frigidimarina]|uniref:methyl-accepting chemotaxis protein n=1 Tax=Shewanella frigidimarina TaxID=56812 RepID=UPI000F4DEE0C|nr:methyl-accepting chemotaxis protein [Shewanella frigidimarina]RPA61364.1 methyl-accepting chemotaxis protein [Shewanella frigidimarina]